jgi:hypothetical protein
MNDHYRYGGPPGEEFRAAQPRHALGGFEERLLTELKMTVAEHATEQSPAAGGLLRLRGRTVPSAGAGSRRWRPAVLSATSMVAAVAVAITITATTAGAHGHVIGSATTARGHGHVVFGRVTTADDVLRNAELAALQTPASAPKPGQFVYKKIVDKQSAAASVEQSWKSADGTQVGLDKITGNFAETEPIPACVNGHVEPNFRWAYSAHKKRIKLKFKSLNPRMRCTPEASAAYNPGMPTTPDALRAYLVKRYHLAQDAYGPHGIDINLAYTIVEVVMESDYLLPQQQAAMYKLLARTPGLTLVPRVADLQGTVGIGIRAPDKPDSYVTFIFDPKTYALLGENQTWIDAGVPRDQGGFVLAASGIVNRPGQLP